MDERKNEGAFDELPFHLAKLPLHGPDVSSLPSLGTSDHAGVDTLAFLQKPKAVTLDSGMMSEDVFPAGTT